MKRSPMKRSTPLRAKPKKAAPERVRKLPQVPAVPPKPRAVMASLGEMAVAQPKPRAHRSGDWLAAVRSLPQCVLCGAHGVEPAHRNELKGMGTKVHDCLTAGICRPCHRGIDQGTGFTREQRRAEIDRAIVLTLAQLVLAGKVGVI